MNGKKARALIAKLGSKDKRVQLNAASALLGLQNPQDFPALLEALEGKTLFDLYHSKAMAIKYPQEVPALTRALGGRYASDRAYAAEALGALKDKRAVPALIAALEDTGCADVYASSEYGPYVAGIRFVCDEAALALGSIGDASAVPALDEFWRRKSHFSRAPALAIKAIGSIGGPLAVRSLVEAVSDPEHGKKAVKALVEIGPEAFPALIEALGRETDRASHGVAPPPGTRPPEPLVSQLLPALIEVLGTKIESIGMGEDWLTRGRAAELLKVIAEHHPDVALRAALPILRRLRLLSRDPVFREALEQIEAVTATSRSLPLPAAAPASDTRTLPRPATAADAPCSGPTASAEGRWKRLRRALKSS